MNNALRRVNQRNCPDCIDTSYVDKDGKLHIIFDVCEVHRNIGNEETEIERLAREDYQRRIDSGDPTQLGYG